MSSIALQRCFNHGLREAAARCPECERFFCRECVTEHAGRVICASCLKAIAAREGQRGGKRRGLVATGHCLGALLLLWLVFYALGRMLVAMPAAFHEGRMWQEAPWDIAEGEEPGPP